MTENQLSKQKKYIFSDYGQWLRGKNVKAYRQEVRNTSKSLQLGIAEFLQYSFHVRSTNGSKRTALRQISTTTDFTNQFV